jgi:hypothetical protein
MAHQSENGLIGVISTGFQTVSSAQREFAAAPARHTNKANAALARAHWQVCSFYVEKPM